MALCRRERVLVGPSASPVWHVRARVTVAICWMFLQQVHRQGCKPPATGSMPSLIRRATENPLLSSTIPVSGCWSSHSPPSTPDVDRRLIVSSASSAVCGQIARGPKIAERPSEPSKRLSIRCWRKLPLGGDSKKISREEARASLGGPTYLPGGRQGPGQGQERR